jgi:hypothetical protein
LPLLPPVPGEESNHPRGLAKTDDIREPPQLCEVLGPTANAFQA